MADYRDIYKTPFLSAKNLGNKPITSTISAVYPETINSKDNGQQDKLVIELDEGEVRIALNKSNAVQLGMAFGRDYNDWIGKVVIVTKKKTTFMGKPVDGLDVQPKKK